MTPHFLKSGQWLRRAAADTGVVLWDGSLDAIPVGTSYYLNTSTTQFLAQPWPWSSVQVDGNDATHGATLSVTTERRRNTRNGTAMKIVMDPGSKRCQPSSRADSVGGGSWTPDNVGTVDRWYGWSLWYDADWGDNTTLANEISGTYWHDPMAFRMAPTVIGNGSMNMSGDENNDDGTGPITTPTSTPRTFYLRRNTVLDQSGYYTDGLGLDKIAAGQVVTGAWMDFVIHVRWSTTTTNAVREVWRDGVFMGRSYSANAVDIGGGASDVHNFRLGVYQNTNITHTRTVYISNARIGTSYTAVDPARAV